MVIEKSHMVRQRLLVPSDCCKKALSDNEPVFKHGKIINSEGLPPTSEISIFCGDCNRNNQRSDSSWRARKIDPVENPEEYQEAKESFGNLEEPIEIKSETENLTPHAPDETPKDPIKEDEITDQYRKASAYFDARFPEGSEARRSIDHDRF